MAFLHGLGPYANTAVAAAFIAGLACLRLLTKDGWFKRDLRSSQLLFAGFILIDLVRKLLPADWSQVSESAALVGLVLFAFALVRGAACASWRSSSRSSAC